MIDVRWPDGARRTYYSPSTAVQAHLHAGACYTLDEFLARARAALQAASERVRATHGFSCSAAMRSLHQIEETAKLFASSARSDVTVVAIG